MPMTNVVASFGVDPNMVVADNVRAELSRQRWTGRKAALALGVTPTYVSRRLRGETVISPGDLLMFAGLLEVPITKFFENIDPQATKKAAQGGARDGLSLLDLDSNQEPTG